MKFMNQARFYGCMYRDEANADGGDGGDGSTDQSTDTTWRDSLPEDIRDSGSLQNFKDIGQLAKSYVETKAMQGNSMRIPGEDASDEARQEFVSKLMEKVPNVMLKPNFDDTEQSKEFYRTLGLPENPDQYSTPEIELPEGVSTVSDERIGFLKQLAHKNNITSKQFEGFFAELLSADAQSQATQIEEIKTGMNNLKQEWGMAFEDNMKMTTFITESTNAPEGLKKAIADGTVGADVVKWIYSVGKQLGKGEGVNFGDEMSTNRGNSTPAEAKEKINEIMNNKNHPYWNASDPGHKNALDKMIELQKHANPS
jgi:hypothetical protein